MVFGCKKKDEEAAPAETPAEAPKTVEPTAVEPTAVEPAADEPAMPEAGEEAPFAAVIVHKVKDFDKWKAGFDAHQEHRKGAGLMGHHLSRGVEDPNTVMAYFPMATTEKFTEMLKSDDMKKAMAEAGVEGEPEVHMMKPVETKPVIDRDVPGVVLMAEVEDFAAWKTVFDGNAEARTKAGIIGFAVNQIVDKPNMVTVLLQAEKAEELTAFLGTDELKAVMAKGGIKGEPKVMMVNSTAAEMY